MPLDRVQILIGFGLLALGRALERRAQRLDRAKVARQQPRIGLADVADAERIDQPVERNLAPRVDGVEQVAHRDFAIAFAVGELLRGARVARLEREDVGRLHDQPVIEERLHLLLAEPLDVEGGARHEVAQPLDLLRRADQPAGAAAHRLPLLAHRMAAAGRALGGELIGLRRLRPLVEHDIDDLRDHVAGALHDHGVADADVAAAADRLAVVADALDVVLVVQRGVLHHHAADRHRLELGDRRQRAGAPDLDLDVAQHGGRLLGREFVRDRPARAARDEAEALLPVEAVELVDDAVDVVVELGALLARCRGGTRASRPPSARSSTAD